MEILFDSESFISYGSFTLCECVLYDELVEFEERSTIKSNLDSVWNNFFRNGEYKFAVQNVTIENFVNSFGDMISSPEEDGRAILTDYSGSYLVESLTITADSLTWNNIIGRYEYRYPNDFNIYVETRNITPGTKIDVELIRDDQSKKEERIVGVITKIYDNQSVTPIEEGTMVIAFYTKYVFLERQEEIVQRFTLYLFENDIELNFVVADLGDTSTVNIASFAALIGEYNSSHNVPIAAFLGANANTNGDFANNKFKNNY